MDLPEDLRNTIVNIYYEFSRLGLELNQGPDYFPRFDPKDGFLDDAVKFFRDAAHLQSSVKNLPAMVEGIRGMKEDGEMEGYKLSVFGRP